MVVDFKRNSKSSKKSNLLSRTLKSKQESRRRMSCWHYVNIISTKDYDLLINVFLKKFNKVCFLTHTKHFSFLSKSYQIFISSIKVLPCVLLTKVC